MVPSCGMVFTYPLLVRLVDGIQGILDCYTLEVSCCHLHAEGEVEINLLDLGAGQEDLEDGGVFHSIWAAVDLPVTPDD